MGKIESIDKSIYSEYINDYDIGSILSLGLAAEMLLSSQVVKEFFSTKDRELFDQFIRLGEEDGMEKYRRLICNQNILSELLVHMRYLKQMKDEIEIKRGNYHDESKEGEGGSQAGTGGGDDQSQDRAAADRRSAIGTERERILGISGFDPEAEGI
jgi:hypothetical protein